MENEVRGLLIFAGTCLLAGGAILRGESPRAKAVRTSVPPVIDGRLDDACWKSATPFSGFKTGAGEDELAATEAFLLYDDTSLYVAFRCHEPKMGEVRVQPWRQRDGVVWPDESVWVYLDPWLSRRAYFEVNFNLNGVTYDAVSAGCGSGADTTWDPDLPKAVCRGADFWSAEIQLPFRCLRLTAATGPTWGINLCRHRNPEKEQETNWVGGGVQGSFHRAWHYGFLDGLDVDFAPYAWEGLNVNWGPIRRGPNPVTASVWNRTGKDRRVRTRVTVEKGRSDGVRLLETDASVAKAGERFESRALYDIDGRDAVTLGFHLVDASSGHVLHSTWRTNVCPGQDIEIAVESPVFRSRLLRPEPEVRLCVEAAPALAGREIVVSLRKVVKGDTPAGGDGADVERKVKTDSRTTIALPLRGAGRYVVAARLADDAGTASALELESPAPGDASGFASTGRTILRDLVPFFPVGFLSFHTGSAQVTDWLSENGFNLIGADFRTETEHAPFAEKGIVSLQVAIKDGYPALGHAGLQAFLADAPSCAGILALSIYGEGGGPRAPEVLAETYTQLAARHPRKLILMDNEYYHTYVRWHWRNLDVAVAPVMLELAEDSDLEKPISVARQVVHETLAACPGPRPVLALVSIRAGSRIPTGQEMRNITFQCLAAGADGIAFWWQAWRPWWKRDGKPWDEVVKGDCMASIAACARETRSLERFLGMPGYRHLSGFRSEIEAGIRTNGTTGILVAANVSRRAESAAFVLPEGMAAREWESGDATATAGRLAMQFEPLEVKVFRLARTPSRRSAEGER